MKNITPQAKRRPILDSAFPSLALMGFCLFLALACIVICAWKIILLEQEREDIHQERLLLQRDKDAFLTYGGELPALATRHQDLTRKVAQLEETRSGLEKSIENLQAEQAKLRVEAGGLSGTIASLEAQSQAVGAELAKTVAELGELRPALDSSRKEAEKLRAQETALTQSIVKKQKDEAALLAAIAGLERSRRHARQFLEKLTEDQAFYGGMEKNYAAALARFEDILAKSASLTADYALKLEEMGKSRIALDQGMAMLKVDLESAAANLDALKKDRASHAALLRLEAEQEKLLREHVDGVAANNKKMAAALELVESLDGKLQAALAAEASSLRKVVHDDSRTRAKLAAAAESLAASVEQMKADQGKLKAGMADMENLLAGGRTESRALGKLAAELAVLADKNRETSLSGIQAGANFAEASQNLQKQVQNLKLAMDNNEAQARRIGEILEGEAERQAQMAKLAREAREIFEDSRNQNEDLKKILTSLKNMRQPSSRADEKAAPND